MQGTKTAVLGQRPTVYPVLLAISLVHLLNDTMQSVVSAILPILKESLDLSFTQVGLIVFTIYFTSSVMQPVVGWFTDIRPSPFLLPVGMVCSFIGMLGLAFSPSFLFVLLSVMLIGLGSAVFHPEGSRVAYMAAGVRRGLAQSIFQVGGNSGQALAPVMTALIFVPLGQFGAVWFTFAAALAILILMWLSAWYRQRIDFLSKGRTSSAAPPVPRERKRKIQGVMFLLIFFVFARSWYHSGISSYFPFFLIEEHGLNVEQAQMYIFLFLAAGALGTLLGGPLADRFGKRNVLVFSMIGSAPLSLCLPYADSFWSYPILFVSGLIVLSSFSVIVVYAQELIPGKIGTVSGLMIGLAFGMGALGAAALGWLAEAFGVMFTMQLISFLPLFGLVAFLLPSDRTLREWSAETPKQSLKA